MSVPQLVIPMPGDRPVGARSSSWRRPRWGAVGGGVALALSLALMTGCAPEAPSTSEILDGPVNAEARSAAISRVRQFPASISARGVTLVAQQIYTECHDGVNDSEFRDGFQMSCSAHAVNFFGWDGDYAAGMSTVLDAVQKDCAADPYWSRPSLVPDSQSSVLGQSYSCRGGFTARSRFLSGSAREVLATSESWGVDISDERWVDGPKDTLLLEKLGSRGWLLALDVSAGFYEDGSS